jgi:hypothetical protein
MAELPDVVPGEPVASSWGNAIRDRTVQRYADATERDTENPSPDDGDLAYLTTTDVLQVYGAGTWHTYQRAGAPGTVRTVWKSVVNIGSTAANSVTVAAIDVTAAGIVDWSKTTLHMYGSAANGPSTQGFVTLWARTGNSLDIRYVRPSVGGAAGAGNAFVQVELVEYW